MRTVAEHDCDRCSEENLEVQPGRPGVGISQIQAHHVVEFDATSPFYLPQSRNSGPGFQHPAPMPNVVCLYFVCDGRTWPHQRHVAFQHINELGQLVKTGSSQESTDPSDPGVSGQFVDALTIAVSRMTLRATGYQLLDIFFVNEWHRC